MKPPYTMSAWRAAVKIGYPQNWPDWKIKEMAVSIDAEMHQPELLEAAKIGLAGVLAWGGKCQAKGEKILAREAEVQAEIIRAAIAGAEKVDK